MRIALTGGTGFVGSFIVDAALCAGHEVTLLSRRAPEGLQGAVRWRSWDLGEAPDLSGTDALVHAAFAHVPGRYRGGEGDDPAGFLRANRDGSLRLFDAARRSGVRTVLHLSSRAVLDGYPPGTRLDEDLPPRPTSLYGEVKADLESALTAAAAPDFRGISLRATGVYGLPAPGRPHKWTPLIADLVVGRPIPPRVSTEVHGDDLARAALLLLEGAQHPAQVPAARDAASALSGPRGVPAIAHASDIILDHRDLALAVARCLGRQDIPAPPPSDPTRLSVLDCAALRRLGWRPGGWDLLQRTVAQMLAGKARRCEPEPAACNGQ